MSDLSATAEREIWQEAKREVEGSSPSAQPTPTLSQVAEVVAAVEESSDDAANPPSEPPAEPAKSAPAAEPTTEPAEPESVPDLSWMSEEDREAVAALPADAQRVLVTRFKDKYLKDADYRKKTMRLAAREKELLEVMDDPAEFLEWQKSRGASKPAAKTAPVKAASDLPPDPSDFDTIEGYRVAMKEWTRQTVAAEVAERERPAAEARAVEDRAWAFRDELGESVTDEQFEQASALFARAARSKQQDPYKVLASVPVEVVLAPYVEIVKRTAAEKPKAKPVTPTAKAASVKSQSATPTLKTIPRWEAEKRQPTDEELLEEAYREAGVSREDVLRARMGLA